MRKPITKTAHLARIVSPDAQQAVRDTTVKEQKARLLILMNERKRRAADRSLYFFSKEILGYNLMRPIPHGEVCEFIETNLWEDTMLLLPRGTYKSTIETVSFVLWLLSKDPNLRLLIASAEIENAKGWLNEIRLQIEHNEEFKSLYGDWRPKSSLEREKNWHSKALRIAPCTRRTGTNSVVVTSHKSTKVSQHFDFAVIDDLMNEQTASSREQITKCEEFLQLLIPILDPQPYGKRHSPGPRKVVGTRWAHDDMYARQIAKDKLRVKRGKPPRWKKMIRKAINSKGELFFPDVFTRTYLEEIRADGTMTKYQFSCQYLNDPQPDEDTLFPLHRFGFWNQFGRTLTLAEMYLRGPERAMDVPTNLNMVQTCDPAHTDKDQSDYTAIVTTGICPDKMRFIQEVRRGQWVRSSAIIDEIIEAWLKYRPGWIGIETVGFQYLLKEGLDKRFKETGFRIPVHELKTHNVRKPVRIRALEPFVSDGKMFFRIPDKIRVEDFLKKDPRFGWNYDRDALFSLCDDGMGALIEELTGFPIAATRDCADALAYQVPHFRKVKQSLQKTPKGDYMTFDWWAAQTGRRQVSA